MRSFPANRLSRADTSSTTTDFEGVSRSRVDVAPSFNLARSEIWRSDVREELAVPRYTKYELDKRREKV
jgi:hypothetical protein